jgi:MIP family channel proteins
MPTPALPLRLLAEALGTFGFFFLGFSGVAAAVDQPGSIGPVGVAAGFGLGLGLMIFALGHLSGGHFNPAVSLGLALGRQFPRAEVVPYWIAQLIGGAIAVLLARGAYNGPVGHALVNAPGNGVSDGKAFLLEAVATFLFLLVIQTVATNPNAAWEGVQAPVAIGGFIFAAASVIGPNSGGSFNPARSLAPALVDGTWTTLWVYLIAPLAGGALAGIVYAALRAAEPESAQNLGESGDVEQDARKSSQLAVEIGEAHGRTAVRS